MTIEEHYQTIAPKLTNWLVASGSPYAEACDLVQETFLRIWKMREDLLDDAAAALLDRSDQMRSLDIIFDLDGDVS